MNYQIVSFFNGGKYLSERPAKYLGGITAYFIVGKEFVHLKNFQNYDERSLIIPNFYISFLIFFYVYQHKYSQQM